MNFTDSPFERMMKQIPRPGRSYDKPSREPAPKRKENPTTYRDIIIRNAGTSDNGVPTKSQTLRGEEEQRSGADFGSIWPEVAERSL